MNRNLIIAIVVVVAANVLAQLLPLRWDMTMDKRYSLQPATREMLAKTNGVEITSYLTGDLNSGFTRLSHALRDMAKDMGVSYHEVDVVESGLAGAGTSSLAGADKSGEGIETLKPILVHERTKNGKSAQTEIYPYAEVAITKDGQTEAKIVNLLINQRGLSGEENLNRSIENLEYTLVSAIADLRDEAPSHEILVVTADTPDDEETRREVDSVLMDGGRVLWALDGVETRYDVLMTQGFAPVLPSENLWLKQLFHYGVRIEPVWVEDRQCVQYPYFFAPLLLTSEASMITRNMGQVNVSLVSPISEVGGEDGIRKEILLASSTASRVRTTPGELRIAEDDEQSFVHAYVPVAYSLEGEFPSAFRYLGTHRNKSEKTRQVVIGTSSILKEGMPGMSNEDFLENAFRWLTDDDGLLALRQKTIALRLLNDERAYRHLVVIEILAVALPIALLALLSITCIIYHKKRYTL